MRIVLPWLLLLSGCGVLPFAVACPDEIKPALVIEVLDARSGDNIAHGAGGWVRDGSFRDTLEAYSMYRSESGEYITTRLFPSNTLGRAGTYEVMVQKAGYREWKRTGVRVRKGACTVDTRMLTARLEPL
jgi:hypothetical protein